MELENLDLFVGDFKGKTTMEVLRARLHAQMVSAGLSKAPQQL